MSFDDVMNNVMNFYRSYVEPMAWKEAHPDRDITPTFVDQNGNARPENYLNDMIHMKRPTMPGTEDQNQFSPNPDTRMKRKQSEMDTYIDDGFQERPKTLDHGTHPREINKRIQM